MMQIGGVDNLVLKQVNLPQQTEEDIKLTGLPKEDEKSKKEVAASQKETDKDAKSDEEKRLVYGDIVGKSSDGDTTRVKKDADVLIAFSGDLLLFHCFSLW